MQSSGPSRPDLKQSILSLYASGPRPQPQAQHSQSGSISGAQASQQSNFGGMNDAFSGLSFGATSPPPIQQTSVSKPSASSGLGTASTPSTTSQVSPGWGGGGFFDSSPKPTQSNHQPQKQRTFSNSSFGAFDSAPAPAPAPKAAAAPQAQPSAALGDMFDFGLPSQPVVNKPAVVSPSQDPSSVFNLSKPTPTSSSTSQLKPTRKTAVADPFGGNDVWGTPEGSSTSFAAPKPAPSFATTKAAPVTAPPNDNGWGNSSTATGGFGNASFQPGPPKVTADEDFGGWSSAAPVSPVAPVPAPKASKPAASGNFGGGDDLFGNVWG
jgi:stromal membrane-associated protein